MPYILLDDLSIVWRLYFRFVVVYVSGQNFRSKCMVSSLGNSINEAFPQQMDSL